MVGLHVEAVVSWDDGDGESSLFFFMGGCSSVPWAGKW
jgi:hypothetical protein